MAANPNRLQKLVADLRAELDTIRGEIADLQQERADLTAGFLPVEEAQQQAAAVVDHLAGEFRERLRGDLARLASPGTTPGEVTLAPRLPNGADPAPGLLAWLAGDAIKEALAAELAAYLEGQQTGPTAEEKAARLREIAKRLDALERKEELTIREAEECGLELDRRGDARPEIVLSEDL